VAAGIIIVREAGGFVKPIADGDPLLSGAGLIASNSHLADPFTRTIRES
jgi:myo-inositol-1(or 4)-monophosphatase